MTHRLLRLFVAAAFFPLTPSSAVAESATCTPAGTRAIEVSVRSEIPVAGAKIVLRYPTAAASLPGARDDASVRERLTHVPAGFSTLVNDRDGVLIVTLASGTATLPSGVGFAVEFDRCGGAEVRAAEFQCTVDQAADATGQLVEGATCTVQAS